MKTLFTLAASLLVLQVSAQLNPQFDSIAMRDGRKLAITRYHPASCSQCPTILIQTPYNRLAYNIIGLPLNIGYNINSSAYNVVIMDWRGFYGSAGTAYAGSPTRGEDGYDAVQWIAAQSWSDGQVGTWGPSALGRVQYLTAKENPPNLVCIVPLVAGPQYSYQEYYPGGVLRTEYVEQLDNLGFGTSALVLSVPYYNLLWSITESGNYYPDSIQVPALMIGGWYDHNVEVMLDFFAGIRSSSPLAVRDQHRLLMGPWTHGGSGAATVGSSVQGQLTYPNSAEWNDSLALLFFDYHLRGINNGWNSTPYITYYQMGENTWQTSSSWPPAGLSNYTFYLHNDGSLNTVMPGGTAASLSYSYHPLDPSPTVGGPTLRPDLDQGPYDQAPLVESRNDILVHTTAPLLYDAVLKGQAQVHLRVSSDKKDTDFAVRLTDVYPDGRSMLVADGIARMRFRNGYTTADTASMVPGTVYDCILEFPHTAITFLAGHKIRLDITSSNYPRYNRNDNSGGVMYPGMNGDSLANPQTAQNTVYMNSIHPSYIVLPLESFLDATDEPQELFETVDVFPNPATSQVTLRLGQPADEAYTLVVLDSRGREITGLQQSWPIGQQQQTLDISAWAPGTYLVQLRRGTARYTGRVVKN